MPYMAVNRSSSTGPIEAELRELGSRIARIRLSRNITQARLAKEAGASLGSIRRLEAGDNTTLDTLIRVLAALDLSDRLSDALPDPDVRPVERVKFRGNERQRARSRNSAPRATVWAWGDEAGGDE